MFVVRGGRGVPCGGAGRCGHLIKNQPGQGAWPLSKGASLARRSLSGQMGRRAPQRDLSGERRALQNLLSVRCCPTSSPSFPTGEGSFQICASLQRALRLQWQERGPGTRDPLNRRPVLLPYLCVSYWRRQPCNKLSEPSQSPLDTRFLLGTVLCLLHTHRDFSFLVILLDYSLGETGASLDYTDPVSLRILSAGF